jgi:hypothetical protein
MVSEGVKVRFKSSPEIVKSDGIRSSAPRRGE